MFLSEWCEFPSAPFMCSVYYKGADKSLAWPGRKQANVSEWREFSSVPCMCSVYYRGADKSLAWPGRKRANVSVRMAWISFGAFPCRKKKSLWQLASRCCWNRARPWRASELVSFLVGLKTYQHHGIWSVWRQISVSESICVSQANVH